MVTAAEITELLGVVPDRDDIHAGLMMVRYFDDEDGGYGAMSWSLSSDQIALLAYVGASIDADEYAGGFTVHQP